jgi:hypothetical protein
MFILKLDLRILEVFEFNTSLNCLGRSNVSIVRVDMLLSIPSACVDQSVELYQEAFQRQDEQADELVFR